MKYLNATAALLCLLILLATGSAAQAQQSLDTIVTGQDETTLQTIDSPEAVRELVSRLSDTEVRLLLLERLDAVAQEQADNESSNEFNLLSQITTIVPSSVLRAVNLFPTMISGQYQIFRLFFESLGPNGLLKLFLAFLIAICAGLLIEFFVRALTRKWRATVDESVSSKHSLQETLKLLSLRFLLDLSGLLAFIILTQIVLRHLTDPSAQFIMHHVLWNLILIPRLFSVVLRFVLAPKRPDLRLIHTTDSSAAFLHRHLVSMAFLIGLTLSILDLKTVPGAFEIDSPIGFWFNLIIHLYFLFIAWRSRHTLIDIINGKYDDATAMEKRVARLYPYYALLVIVCSWTLVEILVARDFMRLTAQGVQFSTMFILLLTPFLDTAIRALVMHMTPAIVGTGELAQRAYDSTKRSYIRIGRLIVVLVVLTFLTRIWGIDLIGLDPTDLGAQTTQKVVEFVCIFAGGYLLWEITTLWLNRKLAAEQTAEGVGDVSALPGGDGGGPGQSRLSTVLPLITWFIQTSIITMTVLMGLGNVGVDITPLLAGAGIVGLAIGFGAQKLVTDIVSGLFFLIDDAFRSGEYVNVEGTVGTVERISLRAMQLRHHRGPVHTIPYGEIPKITNYSRDWAIMKLTFTVPFETDLVKVKKIFKTIGMELLEIPEFADDFLQPFKSQGVIEVDDVGIVVRGKFMVKPGKQFQIRKEIFQRVQNEFERNGIQFARKEVRVRLDTEGTTESQLTEADKKAIGAAASEASDKKPEI